MATQHIGDQETIRQSIEQWLRAKLASDLRLGPLEFPEASGESSVTLLLTAQWGGDTRRLVCRMQPLRSEVFDSHDLWLQYRLMEIMAEHAVPVPALVGYEADTSLLGSDFYLMHFVDGLIPADNPPYAFGSWVTQLSAAQRSAMWSNGLEVVAKIHGIDIDRYALPGLPRASAGVSPLQHEVDKFEAMLDEQVMARIAPELLDAFAYIKAHLPATTQQRLCWGDCRVGNVIWRELRPVAVIDWEMASVSDPLLDVSWWYWIDYLNSVGLGVERLAGLPEREALNRQWQRLTGLSTENSLFYDLFNAVRYGIILERKFIAMKAAGLGDIANFTVPFVSQLLAENQR